MQPDREKFDTKGLVRNSLDEDSWCERSVITSSLWHRSSQTQKTWFRSNGIEKSCYAVVVEMLKCFEIFLIFNEEKNNDDDDDPTLHSWMMIRQKTRSMTPPTAVNRQTITPWGKYNQMMRRLSRDDESLTKPDKWSVDDVIKNFKGTLLRHGSAAEILLKIDNKFEGLSIKSTLFWKVNIIENWGLEYHQWRHVIWHHVIIALKLWRI